MIYNGFYLIASRSAIAPTVSASIITNWLYRLQQENIATLIQNVDMQNELASSRFSGYIKNALLQGWSIEDAHKLATNTLYQTVQIQAIAVSIKTIVGWMLIFGIILLIGIVLYFLQFTPVKLVKIGNGMAG